MLKRFWIHGIAAVLAICAGVAISLYVEGVRQERPSIAIGGPFTMIDEDGRAITKHDLDQTAVALFAGFTHCPDVSPTTLLRLSSLMKQLGSDAAGIRIVLVTVDPERDTPEALKSYLSAFDGDFTGMTGTPQQLRYEPVEKEDEQRLTFASSFCVPGVPTCRTISTAST